MQAQNLTIRTLLVFEISLRIAQDLNHEYLGTGHLLLGLLEEGEGYAGLILEVMGCRVDELSVLVRRKMRLGQSTAKKTPHPYSTPAKKALELMLEEAKNLGHFHVGSEHLLLGLLREEKGVAFKALLESGIRLENARSVLLDVYRDS